MSEKTKLAKTWLAYMASTIICLVLVIAFLYVTAPWTMRKLDGTITLKEWEYQRELLNNALIGITIGLVMAEGIVYVYLDGKVTIRLRKENTKTLIKEVLEETQRNEEAKPKR